MWENYYKNTQNSSPHPIVKNFINIVSLKSNAVDLGCGAGRDTIYLIKNGWNVLGIDNKDVKSLISSQLNTEELKNFKFKQEDFKSLKLEKTHLVISNYSLSFCNKLYFPSLWKEIISNIESDGYFVGNIFGINDSWAKTKPNMTFLTKEQFLSLFNSCFEIIEFNEIEKDNITALGVGKHWHIFEIIARKI